MQTQIIYFIKSASVKAVLKNKLESKYHRWAAIFHKKENENHDNVNL